MGGAAGGVVVKVQGQHKAGPWWIGEVQGAASVDGAGYPPAGRSRLIGVRHSARSDVRPENPLNLFGDKHRKRVLLDEAEFNRRVQVRLLADNNGEELRVCK